MKRLIHNSYHSASVSTGRCEFYAAYSNIPCRMRAEAFGLRQSCIVCDLNKLVYDSQGSKQYISHFQFFCVCARACLINSELYDATTSGGDRTPPTPFRLWQPFSSRSLGNAWSKTTWSVMREEVWRIRTTEKTKNINLILNIRVEDVVLDLGSYFSSHRDRSERYCLTIR